MSRSGFRKTIPLLLTAVVLIASFSKGSAGAISVPPVDTGYDSYRMLHKTERPVGEDILISASAKTASEDFVFGTENSYGGKDGVLVLSGETGSVTWEFSASEGLYSIDIQYASLESYKAKVCFGIQIDGVYPYDELECIELARPWKYSTEIEQDERGNDLLPQQEQSFAWQTAALYDSNGKYDDPLKIYLTSGTHTITFRFVQAQLALDTIRLHAPEELPGYAEVHDSHIDHGAVASTAEPIMIEGETPFMKSDSSILPLYDKSDARNQPVDARKMLLNAIGGMTWSDSHRWIEWNFDVAESGFYKIGLRVKQNYKYGANVYRRIFIDGKVPFRELYNVIFPYAPDWYVETLGDEDPYGIYLDQGSHTIRLEVVTGEYEAILTELESILYKLNSLYRNVMMITGPIPDPLRDYDLETGIPDLMSRLMEISTGIGEQKKFIESSLIKTGSETAILESIDLQVKGFIKDTESMPFRLDSLKANVSALADWLMSLSDQPLTVDYIAVQSPETPFQKSKAGFWEGLLFSLKTIWYSFGSDYGIIGDYSKEGKVLTVWMASGGRDQMQIIKSLIDKSFAITGKTKVNLNLVQGGLIESVLSGKSPDVALFVGIGDPVNLAARGALSDLSAFSGYAEAIRNYYPNTLTPYKYQGKTYGMPLTQEFPMMFCRTDILKEFGLEIPETWDDVMAVAPVLQRKNLQIGIPSGLLGSGIFPSLLIQSGSGYYTSDYSATRFGEESAIAAFAMWTQFYSKYDFPLQYDFFNRFRSGEMPIGIASYSLYGFLDIAAPEIAGLWEMHTIPGTVMKDGSVNKAASSFGGTAAILLKSSKDKENAWNFIRWFASTQAQAEYGNSVEALLGPSGRYPTANNRAINELPWSQEEIDLLQSQWSKIVEVGVIPASYFVDRNISNAFKSVIYKGNNPRSVLSTYAFEINNEITRKNMEIDSSD